MTRCWCLPPPACLASLARAASKRPSEQKQLFHAKFFFFLSHSFFETVQTAGDTFQSRNFGTVHCSPGSLVRDGVVFGITTLTPMWVAWRTVVRPFFAPTLLVTLFRRFRMKKRTYLKIIFLVYNQKPPFFSCSRLVRSVFLPALSCLFGDRI